MTLIEIIGSAISGGATLKVIEYLTSKRKNRAELHKIEAETDSTVSDSWEKLFKQVNAEWHNALSTIAKNAEDILQLRKELDEEKKSCDKKMEALRLQIMNKN